MLRRVIASLVVFVGICVLPLYADFISLDGSSSPVTYEFHMTSTVADGTGTTDNTGDIDAIYYKGIRIFVGYSRTVIVLMAATFQMVPASPNGHLKE